MGHAVARRLGALALLTALGVAVGCGSMGRLRYEVLDSEAMGRPMTYGVYLPPDWSPDERLPVVLLLHGGGDDPYTLDETGTGRQLDRALREERIPRAVIVAPRGDMGFWVNWHDGSHRWEDWVLEEVLPDVQRRFDTRSCPEGCHVVGVSMGGYGALNMGMRHPGRFASLTAISTRIYDTEMMLRMAEPRLMHLMVPVRRIWGPVDREAMRRRDPYVQWTEPGDLGGSELLLAWGDADRDVVRRHGARFHRHLREHGVPHELLVYPGGHGWESWDAVVVEALRRQVGEGCGGRPTRQENAP